MDSECRAKLLMETERDSNCPATTHRELTTMAGLGRFKMTDALPPEQRATAASSRAGDASQAGSTGQARKGKGKGKSSGKAKAASKSLDAEQVREARESAQARNAEASTRDRMVEIGRGSQQAGRQRAK